MTKWIYHPGKHARNTNKYNVDRSVMKETGFASKLEAMINEVLKARESTGEIKDIGMQTRVEFPCGIAWKVDFSFTDVATGKRILAEAKGVETETYRLKRRMYMHCPTLKAPDELELWKGHYDNPKMVEKIERDK
jgi:hypothetical protein